MMIFSKRLLTDILLLYGGSVIFFLFFLTTFSTLEFLLGVPMLSYHLYVSLSATGLFVFIAGRYVFDTHKLIKSSIVSFLLVVSACVSLLFAHTFTDVSYDGQAYHQEAIFQLENGWNPLSKQLEKEDANNLHRWLNHYPKAPWIYETAIFLVTGNVEDGKLWNMLLVFVAFALLFSALLLIKTLDPLVSAFISIVATFNPVSMYQLTSFYVDGQLISLIISLISLLTIIFLKKSSFPFLTLFFLISILVNIKLTTVFYAIIFLLLGFGLLWFTNKVMRAYKLMFIVGASIFFGIILLGFNPYVKNTIYKGHPMYPALGRHAIDYKPTNLPADYIHKNSVYILFASIYAKSDIKRGEESYSEWKIPFSYTPYELEAFKGTSPKEGGFGPFFSAVFSIALIILLSAFLYTRSLKRRVQKYNIAKTALHSHLEFGLFRNENKKTKVVIYIFLGVLFSSLINPMSSVARYVPQIWLLPIIISVFALNLKPSVFKVSGFLLLVLMLFNTIIITTTNLTYSKQMTDYMDLRLSQIKRAQAVPMKIYFSQFKESGMYKFDVNNIDYRVVQNEDECVRPKRLFLESVIMECE